MRTETANGILKVTGLVTGYGKKEVVRGASMSVGTGEIVALIGHNGAGKSTFLKAVFGLIPIWSGRVVLEGEIVSTPAPRDWLRRGVAYQPQGDRVFANMTVGENLEMGACTLPDAQRVAAGMERVFGLFPVLKERLKQRAGTLSGGEKQMLALGAAIMISPKLLLLDEPSLGLAPPLVSEALGRIRRLSDESGVSVIIIEQKVREVLKIARRVYVLRNGSISFAGSAEELQDETRLREAYL